MSAPISNGNQLQGLSAAQLQQLNAIASVAKGSGLFEGTKGGEGFMGSFVDSTTGQTHYIKMLTHRDERANALGDNAEETNLTGSMRLGEMSKSLKDDLLKLADTVGVKKEVKALFDSRKGDFKDLVSRKIAAQAAKLIGNAHNDKAGANGVRFDWKAVARAEKSGDTTLHNTLLMKERKQLEGIEKEIGGCNEALQSLRESKEALIGRINCHEKIMKIKDCEDALEFARAKKNVFLKFRIDPLSTKKDDVLKGMVDCDNEINKCKDALHSARKSAGIKDNEYQEYMNEYEKHMNEYREQKDELAQINSIIDKNVRRRDELTYEKFNLKSGIEKVEKGVINVDQLAQELENTKHSNIMDKADRNTELSSEPKDDDEQVEKEFLRSRDKESERLKNETLKKIEKEAAEEFGPKNEEIQKTDKADQNTKLSQDDDEQVEKEFLRSRDEESERLRNETLKKMEKEAVEELGQEDLNATGVSRKPIDWAAKEKEYIKNYGSLPGLYSGQDKKPPRVSPQNRVLPPEPKVKNEEIQKTDSKTTNSERDPKKEMLSKTEEILTLLDGAASELVANDGDRARYRKEAGELKQQIDNINKEIEKCDDGIKTANGNKEKVTSGIKYCETEILKLYVAKKDLPGDNADTKKAPYMINTDIKDLEKKKGELENELSAENANIAVLTERKGGLSKPLSILATRLKDVEDNLSKFKELDRDLDRVGKFVSKLLDFRGALKNKETKWADVSQSPLIAKIDVLAGCNGTTEVLKCLHENPGMF